ncbi:hypothetical protein ACQ4LE_009533 [Meloidogyne hapla]
MLDIEDSIEGIPLTSNNQNGLVKSKFETFFNIKTRRKRKDDIEDEKQMSTKEDNELESILPWNRVVYLRTWGCSHNNSDSEYMAGLLLKAGFKVTSEKESADIWLLNSCTVKTPSETMLENQVKEAKAKMKRVVVAGCVPQAAPQISWLKDVSIIGVQQIDKIVNVVEETLNGNSVRFLSRQNKFAKSMDLTLPKMRRNEFIEILAINSGCLNHCTYCKTKAARGDLKSFPLNALVDQAKRALTEQGCRELWLTSEDLGAWGRDFDMVIPDLLQALVEIIPDDCMMRMGMTNPPYILDHLEEIAEILNHPKVYSFLHIPVQSGSNAVLSDMKREYTKEHFCQIVDYMIKNVPNIYIATDFICAFPTETEEDFEESMELVKLYKFPSLFINQFYPRPGTPAARLKKINTIEARRRTSEMTRLFHSYHRYDESRIGKEYWVLICERASDGKSYVGHNKCYEHILIPDPYEDEIENEKSSKNGLLLGKWAYVRIVDVSKFYMRSELLNWTKNPKDENISKNTSNINVLKGGSDKLKNVLFGSFICLILAFLLKLFLNFI